MDLKEDVHRTNDFLNAVLKLNCVTVNTQIKKSNEISAYSIYFAY